MDFCHTASLLACMPLALSYGRSGRRLSRRRMPRIPGSRRLSGMEVNSDCEILKVEIGSSLDLMVLLIGGVMLRVTLVSQAK